MIILNIHPARSQVPSPYPALNLTYCVKAIFTVLAGLNLMYCVKAIFTVHAGLDVTYCVKAIFTVLAAVDLMYCVIVGDLVSFRGPFFVKSNLEC